MIIMAKSFAFALLTIIVNTLFSMPQSKKYFRSASAITTLIWRSYATKVQNLLIK
jgi:hypothetical protein